MSAVAYLVDWQQEDEAWTSEYGQIVRRGQLWDIFPSAGLIRQGVCARIVGVRSLQEAFHWFDERVDELKLL